MPICMHPNLKQFTFSDGQTIKCCPGCDKYDEARRKILGGAKAAEAPKTIKAAGTEPAEAADAPEAEAKAAEAS